MKPDLWFELVIAGTQGIQDSLREYGLYAFLIIGGLALFGAFPNGPIEDIPYILGFVVAVLLIGAFPHGIGRYSKASAPSLFTSEFLVLFFSTAILCGILVFISFYGFILLFDPKPKTIMHDFFSAGTSPANQIIILMAFFIGRYTND